MSEEISLREFLEQRLDNQDAILVAIKEQTVKTNGRVGKLETWRAMLIGGWVMLTAILIPTGIFVLDLIINKSGG